MSRSPERISSYRRHFEDTTSSTYQVRVSSPSPVRRDAGRCRSASYTRSGAAAASSSSMAVGRRTLSSTRSRPLMTGVGIGAVCVSAGGAAIDLEAVAAQNQSFLSTRTEERKEMVALNDRLAAYIEKVRTLEQQNKLMEAEIEAYHNRFVKPTGLRMLYEEQLKELRRIADQMRMQRDMAVAAKDAMAGQLEMMKVKYEEALELRKKAEMDIEAFRPDVDAATSARIALEKQLDNLEVEIEFLQRVHREEIEELMKQIYSGQASVQDTYALPDLAGAIQQVQLQYEDIASKNLQEMDSWYRTKFDDLSNKSTKQIDVVRSVREEITGAKKDIQNKERDLESLKTKNEALEAQIRETQEKHRKELEELQVRIQALQLELKSTKEKIALHLREYQELLNVKMSLEIEITTYRKLIEGEDSRLTGMVHGMQTLSLMAGSGLGAIGIGGGLGVAGIGGGLGAAGIGGGLGVAGIGGGLGAAGIGGGLGVAGIGGGLGAAGIGGGLGVAGIGGGLGAAGFSGGLGGTGAAGGLGAAGTGTALGAKGGVAGGIGAGVAGLGDGSAAGIGEGVAIDYSKEQAVEMTERKTVLIRTLKGDDETIHRDMEERTYSISGAAQEQEEE